MAVGGQAPGQVVGTVSELRIVPAWLGEAIEAVDLTTDAIDTVSVALGKLLYGCVAPHEKRGPRALREAGTPEREKKGRTGQVRGARTAHLARQAGMFQVPCRLAGAEHQAEEAGRPEFITVY